MIVISGRRRRKRTGRRRSRRRIKRSSAAPIEFKKTGRISVRKKDEKKCF